MQRVASEINVECVQSSSYFPLKFSHLQSILKFRHSKTSYLNRPHSCADVTTQLFSDRVEEEEDLEEIDIDFTTSVTPLLKYPGITGKR